MKTYYKATRPDGTDFYTGTVNYAGALASGKPLKRLPKVEQPECCSSDVYHASDAPAETLVGGSWPCRLFEVTGRPVTSEGRKFGFRSLRVVRELPAWQALGPNGEAVAALIKQAGEMTPGEVTRLYAAWYTAWDMAGAAARDAARYAAVYAAGAAARDAAWYAAEAAARYAARYAARALVVRDLISAEDFTTLTAPWVSVMGEL